MFFSSSADKLPGKGADEYVKDPQKYTELSQIKDWRKMLSNFWVEPFRLDGLTWNSVEHYYQASKFNGTPTWFKQFSIESKSDISRDPAMAKSAGGKSGKYKKKQIRPKEITIDENFFQKNSSNNMTNSEVAMILAMAAKFSQHEYLKKVLLATKNAHLTHKTRGVPLHRFYLLETVRKCLKENPNIVYGR